MDLAAESSAPGDRPAPDRPSGARRRRFLFYLLAALSILGALSVTALVARQRFLTRGLPDQLPGPIAHASVSPYGVNVAMLDWDGATRELASVMGFRDAVFCRSAAPSWAAWR